MAWLRIDDGIVQHPKMAIAGPEAAWLWITSLCYCRRYLTDGVFPSGAGRLSGLTGGRLKRAMAKLVEVGLWHNASDGNFLVHDFLEWNPSKADVESAQAWDRRRKELYADKSLVVSIRQRDGDICRYCGAIVRWSDRRGPSGGQFDHVIPRGPNTLENIVVACRTCNLRKNDRTPEEAGMPLLPPKNQVGTGSEPDTGSSSLSRVSAGALRSSMSMNSSVGSAMFLEEKETDFERFWLSYPRKVGKEAARRSFEKCGVSIDVLMAALNEQKPSKQWQRDGGQYIPHPATWLNQGRWQDEPEGDAFTEAELETARRVRRTSDFGRCQHDPACIDADYCVRLIASELRQKASA